MCHQRSGLHYSNDYLLWTCVAVVAGQGDSQGSFEYLVYESVLRGVAQSLGLQPVKVYGPGLDRFFDEVAAGPGPAVI
jgi:hypothetical protein